jgi:hypothetical protein
MIKHCDGSGQKLPCPHPDDCTVSCMFNDATRKIKPYPSVPDDIEPVDEQWSKVGTFMLSAAMLILVVFFVAMFLTGVWIWGMLV